MSIITKVKDLFGIECDDDKKLKAAVKALMESEYWPVFEQAILSRREGWIKDTRDPRVYQNQSELSSVMAHVAEADWLLEIFQSVKPQQTDA